MMLVSIVIPAWNEARILNRTLEALLDIDYDKMECEVIVVAGGDDNTYEIAQELERTMGIFSRYIVILQGLEGKNAAIQQGIKEAKNHIIVLLDADTIVTEQWLKAMIGPIEQGICDLTIANPEPIKKSWISDYYMLTKAYLLERITTYSGHSIAFKADIVQSRLDYFFDKAVKVGVDYLLAKRFLEQGRKIMFAKEASVITHLPASLKYFVLTELRWLTALIKIEGINFRTLLYNSSVVAALIFAMPLSRTLFVLSLLFNGLYISKRVRVFLIAARRCNVRMINLFGFVILSYAYHIISLVSYIKYFSGFSGEAHLYQGQRE